MFRRTKSESAAPQTAPVDREAGGKGRPTPTRKEAEAAAKARAKVPRTRKEHGRGPARSPAPSRARRCAQAMKTGDERYSRPATRARSRRFIRDFVDSRFSFIELMIPLLLVTMVLGYSGNSDAGPDRQHAAVRHACCWSCSTWCVLRFRLRRELAAALPRRVRQGHDLLRGHPRAADEVHAAAEVAGQDRPGAARALPLIRAA